MPPEIENVLSKDQPRFVLEWYIFKSCYSSTPSIFVLEVWHGPLLKFQGPQLLSFSPLDPHWCGSSRFSTTDTWLVHLNDLESSTEQEHLFGSKLCAINGRPPTKHLEELTLLYIQHYPSFIHLYLNHHLSIQKHPVPQPLLTVPRSNLNASMHCKTHEHEDRDSTPPVKSFHDLCLKRCKDVVGWIVTRLHLLDIVQRISEHEIYTLGQGLSMFDAMLIYDVTKISIVHQHAGNMAFVSVDCNFQTFFDWGLILLDTKASTASFSLFLSGCTMDLEGPRCSYSNNRIFLNLQKALPWNNFKHFQINFVPGSAHETLKITTEQFGNEEVSSGSGDWDIVTERHPHQAL